MNNRIEYLIQTNRAEGYDKHDPKSLFDLIKFLDANFTLKQPSLTLSPTGTFRCTWKGDDHYFAAEFFGSDIIRYVVFFKLASSKMLRYNGVSDSTFVVDIVSQLYTI